MKPVLIATLAMIAIVHSAGEAWAEEPEKEDDKGLPLETERTIEFETNEGTWISLDLSPNGETVIFELLGDIYTVDADGGDATVLMSGLAFDSQPAYSPDGSMIAFISDRDGSENLWIAQADGSEPKKLSSETKGSLLSPEFSADGDYVYVSKSTWGLGTYEIWMFHIQGGTGVQITKAKPEATTPRNQRHNAVGVTASRDGRYLYYAKKSGGF